MSHIFKTWVTPTLHEAGFKKRGIVYVRDLGSVQHLFNPESDDLNTADKYSFTTNCGIYVPGVFQAFANPSLEEPKAPQAPDGILNVRPGFLTPAGRDSWWELTSSDGPEKDDEVGKELLRLVEVAALPFFDRFRAERAIAEFLSQPRKKEDRHVMPGDAFALCYAAILWKRLGCKDKCRECIERERSKTKKRYSPLPEQFLARFSCEDD